MINFLRGKVAYVKADSVIIDINGVGYHVTVPLSVISALPPVGEEVFLFTNLTVREDKMLLFGFRHEEELDVFLLLNNVSRVGPKVALSVLSVLQPAELATAVTKEDVNTLTKVPGIGRKTAERIILELKDKLKNKAYDPTPLPEFNRKVDSIEEAAEALLALGYRHSEAMFALQEVQREAGDNPPDTEELIRLSLRKLSRG